MQNILRKWPYFKFYANDWLTSNTVLLMNNSQRGAYIVLLCRAWTEESCTLPADAATLQSLASWTDTAEEFEPVLTCFPLTRNQKRRFNPRLFKERQEASEYRAKQSEGGKKGMEARWADKPGVRKKRTTAPAQPVDWMAALKAMPIYAHVNWERELGKIAEWKSRPENKHRIVNQKFMANWVNKIEPPLTNGHAGHPIRCMICEKDYPDHGALKTHNVIYHPKYEG